MKLVRYGSKGSERPGIVDGDGRIHDASGVVDDWAGAVLSPQSLEKLRGLDLAGMPPVEGTPRIGPCVGRVGKIICVGLNYSDHAAESGMAVPKEPCCS